MLWRRAFRWPVESRDRWTTDWEMLASQRRSRTWVHAALFLVTVLTTTTAGAMQRGINPFTAPLQLYKGLPFSATLLLILGVHEFGHYFVSRKWNVRATLPYFIPVPPPLFFIGTMGAVIRIRSPIPNRKALLDIGAAGPLAGLILAVPALVLGLSLSPVESIEGFYGFSEGNSLLYLLLKRIVVGKILPNHDVMLHPIAFAGWFGLFVTAMNLLPIGQLDGGHIIYALFGRRHEVIARMSVFALVPLGLFTGWYGWLLLAVLIFLILGRRHPPPYDSYTPLDRGRKVLAWMMILIFVLCFIPIPLTVTGP